MNTDQLLLKAIAMSLKNDVRIMQALTLLADQPTRLDDLKTDMRVGFLQTVELLAAPFLQHRPMPDRLFEADHVPQTRAGRRADAADSGDDLPHALARKLDAVTW